MPRTYDHLAAPHPGAAFFSRYGGWFELGDAGHTFIATWAVGPEPDGLPAHSPAKFQQDAKNTLALGNRSVASLWGAPDGAGAFFFLGVWK
jgi:hypothetical protein